MNSETFIKYLKELYPNVYDSLEEDFIKAINKKKGKRYKNARKDR